MPSITVVDCGYVPIPPPSKPLQLNISAAFQYYCMKIQPRVDCNMILKPVKYHALNCKGGCAILITVVDCGYVPIPLPSKPLQLNISAAFQYYYMTIQPHADCNMILKPTKYCALICKGGCAISITVVDCGMCQFCSLAVATTIKSLNQACCHNHHHHHLVSSPCS